MEAQVALNPLVLLVVLLPRRHQGRLHPHPRLQMVSFTLPFDSILAVFALVRDFPYQI